MLRLTAGVAVALLVTATPAVAESGMRYWSYWNESAGTWVYASQGAGTTLVTDGSVEGWSFVVSSPTGAGAQEPRVPPQDAFADICAATPAAPGLLRVALVVDPGSPGIAPPGDSPFTLTQTCVTVPEGSTGFDVLAAAHQVRANGGFLCGIDGYPASECAPVVDLADFTTNTSTPSMTDEEGNEGRSEGSNENSPRTTIIVAFVSAALLIAVGALAARRSRR